MILLAALVVAAATAWAAVQIAREIKALREASARALDLQLLQLFAPAIAVVEQSPQLLLVWQPIATRARRLFPDEFARLDRASDSAFPFTREDLQAAHARWTAEWLMWEQHHDAEYKLKVAQAAHDATAGGDGPLGRAKLESVEREKLEVYQRRYEQYIKTAKALHALESVQ